MVKLMNFEAADLGSITRMDCVLSALGLGDLPLFTQQYKWVPAWSDSEEIRNVEQTPIGQLTSLHIKELKFCLCYQVHSPGKNCVRSHK